jgi:hypothetical protein
MAYPWQVGIVMLKVTSPNWDKDDKQRQWKGRDEKGRDRFFRIDDEEFWALVQGEKLNPLIIDTMKVQWAFLGEQQRSARVLRVLEYNGEVLGEPLDSALLGLHQQPTDNEDDLFGRR